MKTLKFLLIAVPLALAATAAQARQSAFQGTWIGEDSGNSRGGRLEISGTGWSHYVNNAIQASGTARFSTGEAALSLANGREYFKFTLLAPGLIEGPYCLITFSTV